MAGQAAHSRRTGRRQRRRLVAEINVVPYIDVMLVLLIIFMVTAPLLQQGVEVELPQAAANVLPGESVEPLVVTVDRDGNWYLNRGERPDEALNGDVLVARVAAQLSHRPELPVLVRGDRDVPYRSVVDAMVLLQRAGAPKVGLMTDPAATTPTTPP